MRVYLRSWGAFGLLLFFAATANAVDQASTITALRIANTVTGGYMPSSDPLFATMVTQVAAGNLSGAASTAANSSYFASYLARRLALQMQNPALSATGGTDNDSTAFLIAHFVGTPTTKPSISTILSENATYLVNIAGTNTHAASLTPAQVAAVNWGTSLVQVPGQNAVAVTTVKNTSTAAPIVIPAKHVGGFVTLSDRVADNSFAMYGATAGTNLRMIEGIWEIATGLSLVNVESTDATPGEAPRFVPEYDPNFFHGQGQAACIACHGGGMSSLTHGYAAVADIFDYNAQFGLAYIATPTTATMKSLGSDPTLRTINSTCNLVTTPTAVCNPDSVGIDPNQGWNVGTTWTNSGVLNVMGWTGPTSGQGLNALGTAIGQAAITYQFLVQRVVGEICPLGAFSTTDVQTIANAANPFASPAGTDDIRTIVALVAANASCQ